MSERKYKIRVLVVEDDKIVQVVHSRMLGLLGYEALVAENGAKALELWREGVDIIFMDLGLPDISGFDVTRQIREMEGDRKHTPIIVLTAYIDSQKKDASLAVGADEVAIKPVRQADLKAFIEKYVKAKEACAPQS